MGRPPSEETRKKNERARFVAFRLRQRQEARQEAGLPPWTAAENAARLKVERMIGTNTPAARVKRTRTMRAKGPKAPNALVWSLISPDGVRYSFRNLAAFVRENAAIFPADQLQAVNPQGRTRAEAGLSMLSPRRKHCQEAYFGWRWNVAGQEPAAP